MFSYVQNCLIEARFSRISVEFGGLDITEETAALVKLTSELASGKLIT